MRALGNAYLLGIAAAAFALMLCPWHLVTVLLAFAVGITFACVRPEPPIAFRWSWAHLVDAATLVLVAGYARVATLAMPIDADYLSIWGIKGKMFWLARGIDWRFLEAPINLNAHVDYPILVPLAFDAHAILARGWNDRMMGLVPLAFGAATLLIVRDVLRRELGELASAIATLIVMPLVFSPYIGLAEGPLIAYATAGLLDLRTGHWLRGAVYLGLAASCKNEGMALVAAAILALIIARQWRALPRMLAAIVIPLPWWILKRVHALPLDLTEGNFMARLGARLADPMPLIDAIANTPTGRPLFWIGAAVACAAGVRRLVARERFLAAAIVIQLAFFIGAYVVMPYDVVWHVHSSWERIVRQLMPLVALLGMLSVLPEETTA